MQVRNDDNIFQAILENDINLIQALVNSGADLSTTDQDGLKPIQLAKKLGYWDAVKVFAHSTEDKDDAFHFGSALLIAVQEDRTDVTKILLKAKANTNWFLPPHNNYAIHFAVINNNLVNVDLLLKNNADITKKNSQNQTAIQLACSLGNWQIVERFLKYIKNYKDRDDGINTQAELVDMNAQWNDNGVYDITLAWFLAHHKEWELLWKFSKFYQIRLPVNTVTYVGNDFSYSASIAQLLAKHHKWELFYHIITNDGANDEYHFEEILLIPYKNKQTLINYWIESDNLSCERFLNNCKENFLLNLRMSTSSNSPLFGMITLFYVKKLQEQCSKNLYEKKLLKAKNNLIELLTELINIPEKSPAYVKAQSEMANIILNQILPYKKLHDWAINILQSRLNLVTTLYDISSNESKLRMIIIQCAAKGGEGTLVAHLYAETLKYNAELQTENKNIKQKLHQSNHSFNLFNKQTFANKTKKYDTDENSFESSSITLHQH